jgi:hypothetical protein
MQKIITTTSIQAKYAQEDKPVLVLTHDQRRSIIPIMYTALDRVKRT